MIPRALSQEDVPSTDSRDLCSAGDDAGTNLSRPYRPACCLFPVVAAATRKAGGASATGDPTATPPPLAAFNSGSLASLPADHPRSAAVFALDSPATAPAPVGPVPVLEWDTDLLPLLVSPMSPPFRLPARLRCAPDPEAGECACAGEEHLLGSGLLTSPSSSPSPSPSAVSSPSPSYPLARPTTAPACTLLVAPDDNEREAVSSLATTPVTIAA